MRVRSFATLVATVAAAITMAACGATDSTAPTTPAASASRQIAAPDTANANLLGALLGSPTTVTPLLRNTPLSAPITVTKTIGILGGTIAIPSAGIAIIVPPLAITSTKTISVTALAGNKIAYEFAPHGLKFLLPLVMTQNLTKTHGGAGGLLGALTLKVGYFADAAHVTTVSELLNVQLDLLHTTAITTLWHFSGYIFASGRGGEDAF